MVWGCKDTYYHLITPSCSCLMGNIRFQLRSQTMVPNLKNIPYYALFRNELFRNFTLQRYKSFLIWQNSFWGLVLWAVLPMIAGCLQAFAYLALQQLLGDCWHGCLYFSSVFSRSSIEGNSDFSSSIFLLVWYSATPRGCVVTRRSWICKSRLQNWLLL